MEKIRPPKDFDLTTLLFAEPVHVPKKAQTTELRAVREGYKRGELTARLQKNGLMLIRALMHAAEYTDDEDAVKFARKYAAVTMLSSAWHSFAEEKPGISHGVTRRRLKLLDVTPHLQTGILPSTEQLHAGGNERIIEAIWEASHAVTAVRGGIPEAIYDQNIKTGRKLGNTALHIVGAPIGEVLAANPHIDAITAQQTIRGYSQELKDEALHISREVEAVPSLVLLAEPNGSTLRTRMKDEMPRDLADAFYETERNLMVA